MPSQQFSHWSERAGILVSPLRCFDYC